MRRHLIVFGTVLCVVSAVLRAAAPSSKPVEFDPKPALLAYAHQIEDEVGDLMQRRSTAAADSVPLLDLQIDLRVLADTLLTRAATGHVDPDVSACAYLRARELCALAGDVQKRGGSAELTSESLDAAKALHQMTFAVPASSSAGQIDELGWQTGSLLLKVLGPLPAGMSGLPPMRPGTPSASESPENGPRTLQELTEIARRAAIGPELKRELLALANQASSADATAHSDDAAALSQALSHCVEIVEAIQRGGLVEPRERDATESQLTRAILLFLDVRTRSAGSSRIEDLLNYRRMLHRVQAMHLSPDLRDRLIPTFTWIRQHPGDAGQSAMHAIETYVRLCAQHDGRDHPNLPAAQKRVVEALEKRFANQRTSFLSDAANLAGTDNPLEDLNSDIAQLSSTLDAIDLIEQAPAALNALAPYKLRPNAGLDRRVAGACSALAGDSGGAGAEAARRFLADVRLMARLAGQLSHSSMPPQIDEAYAHGRLAEFNRRRGELLNGLVAEASVRELSPPQRAQLDAALALGDALIEAAKIDRIPQLQALDRWADWDVPPESIPVLIGAYREATASAIQAFGQRDGQPFKAWQAEFERTRTVRELLDAVASEADACARLPDGWAGDVAKLLTPMSGEPFGLERFASLVLSNAGRADAPSAATLINAIASRAPAFPPLPPGEGRGEGETADDSHLGK